MFEKLPPLLAIVAGVVLSVPASGASAQTRDYVHVVGAYAVYPYAAAVAERLAAPGDYPSSVVEATGTGSGILLFCGGVGLDYPDIAGAARPMTEAERALCRENGVDEITEVAIGHHAIVLATAAADPAPDLTRAEIWQALARTVVRDGDLVETPYRSWSEIDPSLPDRPIRVLLPAPPSGTRTALIERIIVPGCQQFEAVRRLDEQAADRVCTRLRDDAAVADVGPAMPTATPAEHEPAILDGMRADPAAFGVIDYSVFDRQGDGLRAARIGGTEASAETIVSGSYPAAQPLLLYVKNAHAGIVPGLTDFLELITSPAAWAPGGDLVDEGLIPLSESERERMRRRVMSLGGAEAASP